MALTINSYSISSLTPKMVLGINSYSIFILFLFHFHHFEDWFQYFYSISSTICSILVYTCFTKFIDIHSYNIWIRIILPVLPNQLIKNINNLYIFTFLYVVRYIYGILEYFSTYLRIDSDNFIYSSIIYI